MAISHACPGCGADLTRVRAGLEPVYGLRVVVCGCGFGCVRQHPVIGSYGQFKGAGVAAAALMLQVWAAMLLAGGTALLIVATEHDLSGMKLSLGGGVARALLEGRASGDEFGRWLTEVGTIAGSVWFGVSLGAGAWMGGTLRQWKGGPLLAIWFGVLVVVLSLDALTSPVRMFPAWCAGADGGYDGPGVGMWIWRVAGAGASVVVAGLGLFLTRAILAAARPGRAARFGKRRARLRRARRGA